MNESICEICGEYLSQCDDQCTIERLKSEVERLRAEREVMKERCAMKALSYPKCDYDCSEMIAEGIRAIPEGES